MDPDETLEQARDAVAAWLKADSNDADHEAASNLVEAFGCLDKWLGAGGFLPAAWGDVAAPKALAEWGEVGRLQYDEMGKPKIEMATCGHCGRSWNDALITSLTPVPSGRCPFEYDHEYPDEEEG